MAKSVLVNITADTSTFRRGLKSAESDLQKLSGKFKSFGQTTTKIGKNLTLGLTVPLAFAGATAFKAASDMGETIDKLDVIFGKNAKEVKEWSKTSAKSMGISRQAALEAAGTYGNLFQAFGLGRTEATKMSKDLVRRASDLASLNNTSVDAALDALRSGLSGEAEPLKKYGIVLSDVRLKQEAVALELIKSTKEALTPAAKAQAAYSLSLKDSTLAQGNFELTADSSANKLKTLKAQFDDAKVSLGNILLPYVISGTEKLAKMLERFDELSPSTKKLIIVFGTLAATIGPVLSAIGGLLTLIGLILTPVGLVVAAIAALAAGFIYAYKKNEGFRKFVDNLVDKLGELANDVLPILINVAKFFLDVWNALIEGFKAAWDFLSPTLEPILRVIGYIFQNFLVPAVKQLVETFKKDLLPKLKELWKVLEPILIPLLKVLGFIIGAVLIALILGFIGGLTALVVVLTIVIKVVTWIVQLLGQLVDNVRKSIGAISSIISAIYNFGKDIVTGLINGIRDQFNRLTSFIKDTLGKKIRNAFKDAMKIGSPSKVFLGYGINIIDGLIGGLKDSRDLDLALNGLSNKVKSGFNPNIEQTKTINFAALTNGSQQSTPIRIETIQVSMLNPSAEAGRVIAESIKENARLAI